jgi:hypothetical protein
LWILAVVKLDLYEWILGQEMWKMHSSESKWERIGPAKAQKSNGKEVLLATIQKKTVGFRKNTLTLS